jgi:hypothetical protein
MCKSNRPPDLITIDQNPARVINDPQCAKNGSAFMRPMDQRATGDRQAALDVNGCEA